MGKKKIQKKEEPQAFDLWTQTDASGKAKAPDARPKHEIAPGWEVDHDMFHEKRDAQRKRKIQYAKPNQAPAVELPHGGQSFNPQVDQHQEALGKAVRKLQKQKESHDKFAEWVNIGKSKEDKALLGSKAGGGVMRDNLTKKNVKIRAEMEEEEGDEVPSDAESVEYDENGEPLYDPSEKAASRAKRRRTEVGKTKHIAMVHRRDVKKNRDDRRHPNRDQIVEDMDELPELLEELRQNQEKKYKRLVRRKLRVGEDTMTKKLGRHVHHPLPMEVQPTEQLASSLRHVKSGTVHPVQHQVKSLERRNLIPARMRHVYHKKKIEKPKGEVMIRREPFGLMSDVSERN